MLSCDPQEPLDYQDQRATLFVSHWKLPNTHRLVPDSPKHTVGL